MYRLSKGKSNIPIITLSESKCLKEKKIYCVCGTHGEELKPIRVFDTPSISHKEEMYKIYISKRELISLFVKELKDDNLGISIERFSVPDVLYNNIDIDYSVVVKTKPKIEKLHYFVVPKNMAIEKFVKNKHSICEEPYNEAVIRAISRYIELYEGV